MSVVAIDIAFALLMTTIGAAAVWFLLKRGASTQVAHDENETGFAREVLARLQDLAVDVAAGVGEHTSRVEEINEELTATGEPSTENVVTAVDSLLKANVRMQQQLESADEKLQEQARQIESHAAEARTDVLTGLANRRAFDDEMARRLAGFRRHGQTFSVVMIDIDHFKTFNDTYGHQAGDEVLRNLAKVLQQTAREMDLVARYGGEEFTVILPDTPCEDAAAGAERFRRAIAGDRVRFGSAELQVTASFGAAELQEDEDVAAVIERADAALYAAKEAGRNCAYWHDGEGIYPACTAEEPVAEEPIAEEAPAEPSHQEDHQEDHQEAEDLALQSPKETTEAPEATATPDPKPSSPPPAGDGRPQFPDHYHDGSCDQATFREFLGRQLRAWHNGGERPSVVLVRIDDYSRIASELGQQASSTVLRATPQFLKAAFRDLQMLARYDVATYAIVLGRAEVAGSIARAEHLREAAARCALPVGGDQLRFSVSVGLLEAGEGDDASQVIHHAEEALEAALKSGGNATYFHNGQWSEKAAMMLEKIG